MFDIILTFILEYDDLLLSGTPLQLLAVITLKIRWMTFSVLQNVVTSGHLKMAHLSDLSSVGCVLFYL